jgi:hypothetical protein
MVWRQAGSHIDQDPSIISRIVHSPRVRSAYRTTHQRQQDHYLTAKPLLVAMNGAMR